MYDNKNVGFITNLIPMRRCAETLVTPVKPENKIARRWSTYYNIPSHHVYSNLATSTKR